MGIRVEVIGFDGATEALKLLRHLSLIHDCEPSGRRIRWHKKRHDHFVKPSHLRHRRDKSIERTKRFNGRYPSLDGPRGLIDEGQHWC